MTSLQKDNRTAKHAKTAKKKQNHERFLKKILSENLNSYVLNFLRALSGLRG
jgi:hypothetical protein